MMAVAVPFSDGGVVGGTQVATVKESTSLRTKYLGKVPPRLETLYHVSRQHEESMKRKGNSRSQQRHVRAPNDGIRNLRVESRDGYKHDRVHESRHDVLHYHREEVPRRYASCREDHDNDLGECGSEESTNECPTPEVHGPVGGGPFASVVTQTELEREIDQDYQGHVVLSKALVQKFQIGDRIISLEADLRDQVDYDDGLDVLQLEDPQHYFVDVEDALPVAGLVFAL